MEERILEVILVKGLKVSVKSNYFKKDNVLFFCDAKIIFDTADFERAKDRINFVDSSKRVDKHTASSVTKPHHFAR